MALRQLVLDTKALHDPPAPEVPTITEEAYDATPTTPVEVISPTRGKSLGVWSHTSTPAARTGPPRSLSYAYSLPPNSPSTSRSNSKLENGDVHHPIDEPGFPFGFVPRESAFRGALEVATPDQSDRKGKRRESRLLEDGWSPMRWFHESPKEEKPGFDFGNDKNPTGAESDGATNRTAGEKHTESFRSGLRRTTSTPQTPTRPGHVKWGRLRSLLPNIAGQSHAVLATPGHSSVTPLAVNITDELITGGLSGLVLGLWFERDEKDHRRIPVLLHRLRIRISDSLHPLHGHKSVFRIECEYANGTSRWVVYRQLRDFLSLHTHYAFSNAYNRNAENLPEFPRTSMFGMHYSPRIWLRCPSQVFPILNS